MQEIASEEQKMENTQENMSKCMIKKQTVKNKINNLNCKVGHDLYVRLDEFLETMLVKATQRAKCNRRKTVRGIDL